MRIVRSVSSSDLTARARIRDAAVLRFAIDGFGVGLRAIAAEADVTPGLITHHFGSKEQLRAECDEHILAELRALKEESMGPAGVERSLAQLMAIEEYAPLTGYLARSFQRGGALASTFFEHLVSDTAAHLERGVAAGELKPSRDPTARARHLTMQSVGALLVQVALDAPTTAAELGASVRALAEATALPALELYTEGLLSDSSLLDAYLAYPASTTSTPTAES